MAVLYQVEEQGRQTAFVGENGDGLAELHSLLARASAIMEDENSGFAEALSNAAAERGIPLRQVFADEAEALSHDLGHGGIVEQRAVIDLDNGRIRVEYDHRADSLRESLDALAGEWDTESIYESLTEAFGSNPLLDKQPGADTKEEERNIKITQDRLDLLWQLEEFRKRHKHQAEPSDWAIRMCEAFVARSMGFTDRGQWTELLRQRGETLFTFDWKSGSVSDHVVQWCKENHRNWRYSHLGELQVAHGGEWRKIDYFCMNGSETRVYFPPESVQEQQLHALAEDPAIHLRDLLTLGLPDHDVYLVHAAEDVGWVPAADLPRLTDQGKEEFSALLDAKVTAIRPGSYGVDLVLDGVDPQLLVQYDETIANYSKAENTLELFM